MHVRAPSRETLPVFYGKMKVQINIIFVPRFVFHHCRSEILSIMQV
jgi:hypothetical protein